MRFLLVFLFFSLSYPVFGADSFNESPYSTVYSHIHYLQAEEYDPAIAAKAFKIKDQKTAQGLAIQLKQVLDGKGIFIQLDRIPQDPAYSDSLTRTHKYVLHARLPEVYLERAGGNWYYSDETVKAIPELYKQVFPFGSAFWPKWFPYKSNKTILGLHPWQWGGMSIILGSFILVYFIFRFILLFFIRKIVERRIQGPFEDQELLKMLAKALSLIIALFAVKLFVPTLLLSNKFASSIITGIELVSGVITVLLVYKGTELGIRYAQLMAKKTLTPWDDQLVLVVRRFSKLIILVLGLGYILNILDVNLTAVIAGISIGGLAIALAAQDTVKNFIGSIMIFMDRPFRIGDMIKGDNFEGVVQEVGFRSTRIRTVDESVIAVPNGRLADMTIDNRGKRIIRRFKSELEIPHHTPQYLIDRFMQGLRTIINKHPNTQNATLQVYFSNITPKAIIITVNYKYTVLDNKDEFSHRQYIFKHILALAHLLQIELGEQPNVVVTGREPQPPGFPSPELADQRLHTFYDELEDALNPGA